MEISILALPLIASIISGFFGKFIGDRNSEIVTSLLVSISAILSAIVFYEVIFNQYEENIMIATWINSGSLEVNWSMKIDALSSVMLVVVTFVSALVHIYSIGYMSHGTCIQLNRCELMQKQKLRLLTLLMIMHQFSLTSLPLVIQN